MRQLPDGPFPGAVDADLQATQPRQDHNAEETFQCGWISHSGAFQVIASGFDAAEGAFDRPTHPVQLDGIPDAKISGDENEVT